MKRPLTHEPGESKSPAAPAAKDKRAGPSAAAGRGAPAGTPLFLRGPAGGQPLPEAARARLEAGSGADLGAVRVHTDAGAADAAASAGARAITVGNDIHFGSGAFDPSSREGLRLLAHEPVHTIQQSGAAPDPDAELSDPADAAEVEAGAIADAIVDGGARNARPAVRAGAVVARQPEPGKKGLVYDLSYPAQSDPFALQQMRSNLNPKRPAVAIVGGRGSLVAHHDMVALGFVLRSITPGGIRHYRHPDFPGNPYQIIVNDPETKPEDLPDPNDPATAREGDHPVLADARSTMREWQRITRQTLPIHEKLWALRAAGKGDTPEYDELLDQADQLFDEAAEWETDFRDAMPEWREGLADDPEALADLDGLATGDVASLRTWVDDFDQNRDPGANQRTLDEAKRKEEELKKLLEELKKQQSEEAPPEELPEEEEEEPAE